MPGSNPVGRNRRDDCPDPPFATSFQDQRHVLPVEPGLPGPKKESGYLPWRRTACGPPYRQGGTGGSFPSPMGEPNLSGILVPQSTISRRLPLSPQLCRWPVLFETPKSQVLPRAWRGAVNVDVVAAPDNSPIPKLK
ncbi:hypothetical protein GWK47_002207 [Chionoecetes opilio]|uniref:Uncharacterized protein n=1 Tax=Chionoecetes opilio TaxID=41210 RepID=A0A8J4XQ23_CHIOP|nr:hypothetical protein GWK47_002207 [Chionoecetes opilio]